MPGKAAVKAGAEESRTESWRLFIAIPVPEAVKEEIERARDELRRALPSDAVRWTTRPQFHLTLKFLGDVPADRVPGLKESLGRACAFFPAFRLRSERVGFFPDLRSPRVVWVWVHDARDELPRLQAAIEAATAGFTTLAAEGKFTGHITLGRAKEIRRPQADILAKLALGMTGRFFGEWMADRIAIVRSELAPGGSRYTTLAEIPLAGTATLIP